MLLALVLVTLSGCAELACRSGPLQRELQALESEFHEVQGNLARGYAIHVRYELTTEPYTDEETYCAAHDLAGNCTLVGERSVTKYRHVERRIEDPVAIDMDATRERSEFLWGRIRSLRPSAYAEYEACITQHG